MKNTIAAADAEQDAGRTVEAVEAPKEAEQAAVAAENPVKEVEAADELLARAATLHEDTLERQDGRITLASLEALARRVRDYVYGWQSERRRRAWRFVRPVAGGTPEHAPKVSAVADEEAGTVTVTTGGASHVLKVS